MIQGADELLDERATARLLGVAPATLARWRYAGKHLRFVRIGRLVKYRRSELESFLADAECSSTSDNGGAA